VAGEVGSARCTLVMTLRYRECRKPGCPPTGCTGGTQRSDTRLVAADLEPAAT
jgi:hypothetical protein